jgi:hypothetical protein
MNFIEPMAPCRWIFRTVKALSTVTDRKKESKQPRNPDSRRRRSKSGTQGVSLPWLVALKPRRAIRGG